MGLMSGAEVSNDLPVCLNMLPSHRDLRLLSSCSPSAVLSYLRHRELLLLLLLLLDLMEWILSPPNSHRS